MFVKGGENFVTGNHHTEIDDIKAIAGEDDADDVFANVVDVAFDRGHDDFPGGEFAGGGFSCRRVVEIRMGGLEFLGFGNDTFFFFLLHQRLKPSDGLFHDAG